MSLKVSAHDRMSCEGHGQANLLLTTLLRLVILTAVTGMKPEWKAGASAKLNLKPRASAADSSNGSSKPNTPAQQAHKSTSNGGTPVKLSASQHQKTSDASSWKVGLNDLTESDLVQVSGLHGLYVRVHQGHAAAYSC